MTIAPTWISHCEASTTSGTGSRETENQMSDSTTEQQQSAVKILEREQFYLKQIFNCRVCCKNTVKDLFLPCGELVACSDCSKLLTHCPSCNKKILATVTTYFS
ncbi:unnamed protein product [Candidula unifasciata]|uniref:RING-type domain-containing protein n=1 Tax=Candidula unifasciata TaxID=100452 RepID=A0A8S3ZJJ8_9EUPU|nr:unnamed protein product [Candidula unifasciata]